MSARLLPAVLLAAVVLLAGCAGYTGSLSNQVRQWANGASWDSNNGQIVSDLGNLAAGEQQRKLLPLRTACEAFAADVAALYDNLPTPDTALTDELNDSLTNFDTAAHDCYGASSFSSASFTRYRRELATAKAQYKKAQSLLAGFGVK